jgi:Integrase core domain
MMVDAGVASLGESTVYRVLSEADLLARWKRSTPSSGEYNFCPVAPNQQWHTDVMYAWAAARFYFLVSFVDAFSRYIVHQKPLISLDGKSVAIELQAALEAVQGARPRIVHDHGSEFVNRDVAAVVKTHNLIDIKTKRRLNLYLRLLCHFQRVVDLDAQVPHGAFQFSVDQQQLHDTQILGPSIDQRCLCTPHRVGSVRA